MKGLLVVMGIIALGVGLFIVDPPHCLDEPVVQLQSGGEKHPQSMVARMAEAGLAMRQHAEKLAQGVDAAIAAIDTEPR